VAVAAAMPDPDLRFGIADHSARWQATRRPPASARHSGSTEWHLSMATGQRVQNRQHSKWDLARVREELDKIMTDSFQRVLKIAEDKRVSLRVAAYILGIGRVGRATVLAGI